MFEKKKTTGYLYLSFIVLLILQLCINNNWLMFSSTDETITTESSSVNTDISESTSIEEPDRRISSRTFDPDYYEILDAHGLFIESESDIALNVEPTRLEGVVMLIKLLGKETEVSDLDNFQNKFADVPLWGQNYIYYAYINKLADSLSEDMFGADMPLSLNEYMAFVLRALGYDDSNGDFIFSDAYLKGEELGLISRDEIDLINKDIFSLGDMANITYKTLSLPLKDQTIKLKETLADNKTSRKDNNGRNILLQEFLTLNKKDYTTAILKANEYLESLGGGTLVFDEGNYLIKPNVIFIPSNVKWLGDSNSRLYTQESKLYNVLISTNPSAKNIYIKNIIFDQMGDGKLTPDIGEYKGCFIIHVNDSDNVKIENCTFYTYGVCAVLSQSSYTNQTNNISVRYNKAYFQRKTSKFYDVSVFNIDARNVIVEDNIVESLNENDSKYWKARTAYEVHMPNGSVINNKAVNTEVGILHVAWPALWDTYEIDFEGSVNIENNSLRGAIIGVSLWGPTTLEKVVTRNMSVVNNFIGLYLSEDYVPAQGIAIVDGDIGNGEFDNILISKNRINCTVSKEIGDLNKVMDLLIPGKDVGAICANTSNSIKGMIISDNVVNGFPYAFLNLYKRDGNKTTDFHQDVQVTNNIITDSGFIRTHEMTYEGLFSLGNSINIDIRNNTIKKNIREPIYLLSISGSLEGLSFVQNDFSSLNNGVVFEYSDFNVFKEQNYDMPFLLDLDFIITDVKEEDLKNLIPGYWIGSKKIEVEESSGILPGDRIFTPNNQPVIVTKVEGKYLYVLNDMTGWSGNKYLKARSE